MKKIYLTGLLRGVISEIFTADNINDVKTALDGNRLDELHMVVNLKNRKDCEDLISLLKIHSHCFSKPMIGNTIIDKQISK
jgi:hypothetical protein